MASKTLVIKIDGDPTGFKAATEIAAREARKTADIQERLTKKHLTDEQVALATRNRLVQKGNEERIKAATTAATAESGWAKAVGSVGAAMGPVIGQMLTIGALTSVVGAIAQMWSDMRESTSEAAKNIGDVRDRLNELAALKGRLGDTTTELADQLRFRSKTLQTEDSAIAYQKAAINYGSANIKSGMINEDEFRKAMEIGGKFQAAEGGAAGTHGELTGIMPALLKKKNATAEDIGGGVEKLFNIMQLGGFDFSSGAQQIIDKQSYTTGGTFKDFSTQAALQSMFSVASSKGESGTRLDQFVKGTSLALSNASKGRVEGDAATQAEYLKGLGGEVGMEPQVIGKLIADDVRTQREAAAKSGAKFESMDYLKHKGYTDAEDRRAVLMFAAENDSGRWGAFERSAATATGLTPKDMAKPGFTTQKQLMANFTASEQAQKRREQIGSRAVDTFGAGPVERYDSLQKQAFDLMKNKEPSKWYGDFKGWKDDHVWGGRTEIHRTVLETAMEEAKRVGIDANYGDSIGNFGKVKGGNKDVFKFPGIGEFNVGMTGGYSIEEKATQIETIMAAIAARRDATGAVGNVSNRLLEKLVEQGERQLKASQRNEVPAPIAIAPPPPIK